MNNWRIYVAGITLQIKGGGDYKTLKSIGIFESIKQIDYYQTQDHDDMWIYSVKINGKEEIAVIKRTEGEKETHPPIME